MIDKLDKSKLSTLNELEEAEWHAAADVSWVADSRQDPATEPKL